MVDQDYPEWVHFVVAAVGECVNELPLSICTTAASYIQSLRKENEGTFSVIVMLDNRFSMQHYF